MSHFEFDIKRRQLIRLHLPSLRMNDGSQMLNFSLPM